MRLPLRILFAVRSFGFLFLAACIWLPCLHLFFNRNINRYRTEQGLSPVAQKLANTYLEVWSDPSLREQELASMRKLNPEWDFMSRTYLVLALANMSLRDPQYSETAIEIMDAIIADTLDREKTEGHTHFLLSYGHTGQWAAKPPRSIFVDGEIAMMMAARRFVKEDPVYIQPLTERIEIMISQMKQSPILCAESYPNECWLFCNTVALAAIRMADTLDGADHSEFLESWTRKAKEELIDTRTGILISAFDVYSIPAPCAFGPEGSTIWMAAHMLEIVAPKFAQDQYQRARNVLGRNFLGFGYSREWPHGQEGSIDVDSGPVIPFLGASASASGLAILAAAAFEDEEYFKSLMTSLECAGFPLSQDDKMHYQASNQVGDAVLLYAMTEGPLWDEIKKKIK